jgi:glycerol-3-phosphate acyltransferase PlsX
VQPAGASQPAVAVDANGADLGPREVAAGAALAAARGVRVLLFGPLAEIGEAAGGAEVIDAPVSIAKSADPVRTVRTSPDASIVRAARAVAAGDASALVCAGGTGTALAAGLFNVKRAPGIYRPALALPLPTPARHLPVTLLDVGANTEARAEHLVQFAFMGAAFAHVVLGIPRPRVALLSNGEEQERGSEAVISAHDELARLARGGAPTGGGSTLLEFVGNVEGDEVVSGAVDVVVTDGFTGNVALKLIEGVSATVLAAIRTAALSSPRARIGGALMQPALRAFRGQIDPEEQGGAYLLGLRRLGVIPHGRFSRRGVAQAILRAHRGIEDDLPARTHAALQAAGALRMPPVGMRAGAALD